MDKTSTPREVGAHAGLGPDAEADDLTRAIASAWQRHAQRVKYLWPGGCGGYAMLQTPEVMADLGFQQAVREVASLMVGIERARIADMCGNMASSSWAACAETADATDRGRALALEHVAALLVGGKT